MFGKSSIFLMKGWVCLVAGLLLSSCGGRTPAHVPLPPLDADRDAATADLTEYRLQAGDTIRVKYLYHPELNVKVPIRPDGDVSLQVAGLVHAAGLTTDELEQVIKERSSHRLRDPEINVMIAALGERKVFVLGEVRTPGFVVYREGMTPLQAIVERGGFTTTARVDSVLRLSKDSADYQGTRLDLSKPLNQGVPEGVELAVGDVVFVPRTFIGDINLFVTQYIRGVLPIEPRIGAGTSF